MSDGPFKAGGSDRPDQEPGSPIDQEPGSVIDGPEPGPPRPPAGIVSQWTWVVGAAFVVLVIYVTINTLRTDSPGSRGVTDGQTLPPFAAPLALANLKCKTPDGKTEDCYANVLVKENDGDPKACDARREGALNSCDLIRKGPLVIAFLVAPSQRCIDQISLVDRVARRYPGVQFVAVAIRGDHAELNRLIRDEGWKIPVLYDRDGAIANAYAVAVCPTITFARQGGEVAQTTLGSATEAEIERLIRRIE